MTTIVSLYLFANALKNIIDAMNTLGSQDELSGWMNKSVR